MKYIATKIVDAVKMHKSEARTLGYRVPADVEKANNDGYEVTYENGHKAWRSTAIFESDYKPLKEQCECKYCKEGESITRDGFGLDRDNDLTYQEGDPYYDVDEFISIKYCPFCGRKLH